MESRRRYLERLGVVLVVAQLPLFVSAQACLLAAGRRLPPFREDNDFPRLPDGTQAIITSYKFKCCGNITTWQTYVLPESHDHERAYDITFQVWRPSPAVQDNGCYSRVGENIYTSISLGNDGLVSVIPEPSNILTVQPGDVVGYYTLNNGPESEDGNGEGIQLDTSQHIDSVWYHTNTRTNPLINRGPECPYPVGTELVSFTNAAPLLSVSVSSFTCPPTPTILRSSSSPSSSTSLPPSIIATTTSVPTQLSNTILQPSRTPTPLPSITSPVLSISISISPTPSISEGSAALSTAVIASLAAVGGSALLLTLLMLLLAITIANVQHKRVRTLAATSSVATNQQVNRLPMEMQGNESYMLTSDASTINTESNLAYEAMRSEVSTPAPPGFDELSLTESHLYESVNISSEVFHPVENHNYLQVV